MTEQKRHEVWVLENFPLGAVVAENLEDELVIPGVNVGVISHKLFPELLKVHESTPIIDEELQLAFLMHLIGSERNGITIAVLHLNSRACLQNTELMIENGIKPIARIPTSDGPVRDVSVPEINRFVKARKIPHTDYNKIGSAGYSLWVAARIRRIFSHFV